MRRLRGGDKPLACSMERRRLGITFRSAARQMGTAMMPGRVIRALDKYWDARSLRIRVLELTACWSPDRRYRLRRRVRCPLSSAERGRLLLKLETIRWGKSQGRRHWLLR